MGGFLEIPCSLFFHCLWRVVYCVFSHHCCNCTETCIVTDITECRASKALSRVSLVVSRFALFSSSAVFAIFLVALKHKVLWMLFWVTDRSVSLWLIISLCSSGLLLAMVFEPLFLTIFMESLWVFVGVFLFQQFTLSFLVYTVVLLFTYDLALFIVLIVQRRFQTALVCSIE